MLINYHVVKPTGNTNKCGIDASGGNPNISCNPSVVVKTCKHLKIIVGSKQIIINPL